MSIVLIDDIIFNDNDEVRTIRYNNCIFFLVLNGISIFSGLFYLYFYFIIPYYQNSSNSLSFYLNISHLISNTCYFLIFFEFYLYEPIILSVTIKIITMFNPLIILCIYYWSACLTHNLYVTYYNYTHNMDKRIKFYKYLLFIILVIFYLYTLFNIQYNDSQVLTKSFTFISNYSVSFLEIFYIWGFFMICYIIIKLYYVINKKEDFVSVHEYQENEERNEKIKNIFNSVIARNISFIIYFLITFTPANIIMILKYFFGKSKLQIYFIDYMVIMLISFNGTFLFFVRLFDPLMRSFIINLLLFNREFIAKYKENLIKEKNLNESFITNENIYNGEERYSESRVKIVDFPKNKNFQKLTSFPPRKINSDRNLKSYDSQPLTDFNDPNRVNLEMKSFESLNKNEANLNINDEFYDNDNDNENKNSENKDSISLVKSNISSRLDSIQSIESEAIDEKEKENGNGNENTDNNNNSILNIDLLKQIEKEKEKERQIINERNNSKNSNKTNKESNSHSSSIGRIKVGNKTNKNDKIRRRYNSICHSKAFNQELINRANRLTAKNNKTSLFIRNFRANNNISRIRANSISNNLFQSKLLTPKLRRRHSSSKSNNVFYHEEISSFALMNYHLEINENLLRMIAISISINECRIYDDIKEYKQYYKSTIPWKNTDFYEETTLFKEYTDDNIPSWLGIKNDGRFQNVYFKIMSYCPFVFHHIRLIDNISIDSLLSSLDPLNNIKTIKEMKVSGGRGNNSLICTWDKKIIVKTINDNEREILIDKMIIEYHCLMKESRSILSRIYGLFKIELRDKGSINVIVQRNMEDLPLETKVLAFDFKGSTVDRQTIDKDDVDLEKDKLMAKYKNKVLKDIDLGIIGLKFVLGFENWQKIMSIIDSDSSFLQNLEVTDYSLIIFVHKYRKEDLVNNKGCSRIFPSKDNKYIYNFSIVDFLGPFNFEKKGEKLAKSLVGYIKNYKDTNFSVLDPYGYGKRFRSFCKKIIIDG